MVAGSPVLTESILISSQHNCTTSFSASDRVGRSGDRVRSGSEGVGAAGVWGMMSFLSPVRSGRTHRSGTRPGIIIQPFAGRRHRAAEGNVTFVPPVTQGPLDPVHHASHANARSEKGPTLLKRAAP